MSTAASKREEALGKLVEAKALQGEDGTISAENTPAFDAIMDEFRALDAEAGKLSKTEGNADTLAERFAEYTGKATGTAMTFQRTVLDSSAPRSLGEQFVSSKAYKELQESGALASENSRFRSDPVIADSRIAGRSFQGAATDIIQTETSGPSNALVLPHYLPGILPLPQAPLTVRSLFANENMPSGDTISYAAQTGFDNAAAAVAQAVAADGSGASGGVKPQSSIAWTRRTAPAETIATWMATTRQSLSDASQARSLIDNQGRLMIKIEEDDQLLNGNGTSPNISGILDQVGIQTLDLTGEDNLDGVRTARRLVKTGVSRLDPTFIVLNPEDSEEFDLLKDGNGQYRGGNPIGNFNFNQPIWGLQRVESESLAQGTALVGARAGATVFDRQPLTVLTADQHADFFVRNLVVILFEERLAFPVYFPTAFVEITLGDFTDGS
ncbi:MAG TPA: phage major capsid protein [Actinomycetota bacterium]